MLLRRCAVLYCAPREALALDLQALLTGNSALVAEIAWVALAPHIGAERGVDAAGLVALGVIGPSLWLERADCERRHGAAAIAALLDADAHGQQRAGGATAGAISRPGPAPPRPAARWPPPAASRSPVRRTRHSGWRRGRRSR